MPPSLAAQNTGIPSALQHFSSLPPEANVRLPIVKSLFSVASATVWRWSKNGILPAPIKLSGGTTVWNVGQLRETLTAMREAH